MTARKTGMVDTRYRAGPFCGAPTRNGRTCRHPAGFRTDHAGQGRCIRHGGNTKITHGRYSSLSNRRVADILEQLEEQDRSAALDLLPEVNLLRAMTIDFINRYDEFVDALMAWYADPETRERPRRVMDITDCVSLVEAISRVALRMHTIQSEGAITLDTFRRVTEQMGIAVATIVRDERLLRKIEAQWNTLVLDARKPPLLPLDSMEADIIDSEPSVPSTEGESAHGQQAESAGRQGRPRGA